MARSRAHLRLVPDPPNAAPPMTPRTSRRPREAAAPVTPVRRVAPFLQAEPSSGRAAAGPEPLWRELLGAQLRARRRHRGERLADVAARAGVSPQYLSEIERGRKEPSSEMIGAIGRALETDLAALTLGVAGDLRRAAGHRTAHPSGRQPGPTAQLRAA